MRSALGIRRIADVEVRQVMHATDADILRLQRVMAQWKVPQFRAWPLLLRALTHPSISNWAERILNVRKRSLGPSTLELLGDRVVGTAVALQLLRWQNCPDEDHPHSRLAYAPKLSSVLRGLVGNRGMALVARQIGIDRLLRWEKPLPPMAHRSRLDQAGFDLATGFSCNTEINAFANAYEAVAAAVYLDCALPAATDFVANTLLRRVEHVQNANAEIPHFEERLVHHVCDLVKQQVAFITTPKRRAVNTFEPLECHVMDLQPQLAENRAHDVFYCAIALRNKQESQSHFAESDFIAVASHFSVETARIAALTQAIDMLSGNAPVPQVSQRHATRPVRLRSRVDTFEVPQHSLEANFTQDGRWQYHSDYHHLAKLLQRVRTPGTTGLDTVDATQIQERIQGLRRCVEHEHQGWNEQRHKHHKLFQSWHSTASHAQGRPKGEPPVCPATIERCVSLGQQIQLESQLARNHEAPFLGIESAPRVAEAITNSADELYSLTVPKRSARVKAYHVLGHNAVRLWSVQSSMQDCSEERVNVVSRSEEKSGMSRVMQRALLGDRGLADVEDLRVNRAYVAIGMCIHSAGCPSAMAWLSGAERIAADSDRSDKR